MDLVKLQRMVAIYEAGSFRQAARDLGISQPALTWSMHQLEETLNGRLFERGPRGIRPTPLCDRLVRRARLIFREQERILDEVADSTHNQTINMGVHSIFLTDAFARCIAEFSEQYPSTTLRVFEGFSSQLLGRLQQGEVDFACCAIPAEEEHGGTLLTEPLGTLNYSVVAAATHPVFDDIAKRRPISQYRWVEFDTAIVGAFPGQNDIVSVMATAGRDVARKSVRTASMDVIRLLVLSGDFIGLIADERVAEELENGTLRRVPGTEVTASQFGFVSMAENFETSACKALRAILEKSAFEPMRKAH
ncbi:MAG: LysR family transcriptional regulator [Novosphingobium sp.]